MNRPFDVTLVTSDADPTLAEDDLLLRDALQRAGARVRAAVWDDATVDWRGSALTVIRSTWDYFRKFERFSLWLDHAETATRLINAPDILRWNADKRYLEALSANGVRTVPTQFIDTGSSQRLAAVLDAVEAPQVVIKPTIGGASFGAARFDLTSQRGEAFAHAQDLLRDREVMVQPYLKAVETERERSLVFLGGAYSHAFWKAPFTATAAIAPNLRRQQATPEELAFAEAAIAASGFDLDYARVDIVPGSDGPLLMELELIEPALLFTCEAGSAERLAAHLLSKLAPERPARHGQPSEAATA